MIADPVYKRGELLPDEITLSSKWGVSRSTVRTAMSRLVTEGLLQRQSGVGTSVRKDRLSSGVAAWHSFTREMERRGVSVQRIATNCTEVNGLDGVMIGPHDLSVSLGVPKQYDAPEFDGAVRTILRKAREHGVGAGIFSMFGVKRALEWAQDGLNLIVHGADITAMRDAISADVRIMRGTLDKKA